MLGLLLVVPGVLLALRWFAVPAANVVERLSIRQGFRRSRDLARDANARMRNEAYDVEERLSSESAFARSY